MNPIALDTETFYRDGKTSTPSVKSQGYWGYTNDPEFEVLIVSVCDGGTVWAGEPKDFNWEALRGRRIISHNAAFDRAVYRRLVALGLAPAGLDTDWNCSMNLAAYSSGGAIRSLKDAAAEWLGVDVSKDVRDALSGKRVKDLLADGTWRATLRYAEGDAVNCWKLWDKLSPAWPAWEYEASAMTLEQSEYGVAIDRERLDRDIASLQEAIWASEKVLPWIERGAKPTSPIAIAEECRAAGIPCPPVKSRGDEEEEEFLIWEATHGPKYPWVSAVGRLRSLRKILSGHEHVRGRLRPDGRFDFELTYWGAHTGRWSGRGGFNMQNMRAKPLVVDLANHGTVIPSREAEQRGLEKDEGNIRVIDQRALFVPGPGCEMATVDLSQIEPRLLHWTTGNFPLLEKVAEGMSIYEAYARTTPASKPLWTAPGSLKTEDPLLYKAVKIQVLQLGYGSAWKKYLAQALDNGLEMDEAGAKEVVTAFRAANPAIAGKGSEDGTEEPGLWATLGNAIREAGLAQQDCTLRLPNGREMVYRRVRRALQKVEVDPETGESRPRYGWCADVGGRKKFLYGGLATENFIQAFARDVFVLKALAIRRAGFCRILWTIHDEGVLEFPAGKAALHKKDVIEIMRKPVEWIPKCPLDADYHIVPHYLK